MADSVALKSYSSHFERQFIFKEIQIDAKMVEKPLLGHCIFGDICF